MSGFWNKPKSLYDIADEVANSLDDTGNWSQYAASTQLADNSSAASKNAPGTTAPSANPPHVNSFFDSQHDRISQLANEMNVPPNLLLGLSAGESNWGRPQGQNNLFGFSDPSTGRPFDYSSPDASINAFRNSQWYGRLQNKTDADEFVNELLDTEDGKKKYNSVNPNYGSFVHGMINTIDRRQPIWEQSR